jgi:hypothetical protein
VSTAFLTIGLLAFLAFIALVKYGQYLDAKKRQEGMARLATARGWSYAASDDRWITQFDGEPFGIGFDQRALNVVRGEHDGRRFIAFDYWYSTREGSGKSRRTVRHSYSIIGISTTAVFPHLSVMPEHFVSRWIGRLTDSDIEFESEDFNRAFTVTCEDRKFATDVIHPRMMQLLLTTPNLGWRLTSGTLVVATEGEHGVARIDAVLTVIDQIIDLFPDYVWKQAGVADPGAQP